MRFGIIFHFEDFGLTCPTNAARLWWNMSGRGGTESGLSLQGGGAFGGELKGTSCCYMFK